ncbi:MAG TPA: hypothetical protein ENH49_06985 [Candidatus Marinimicrobia bacterium]|nr:hypothetical protein [Candidatus Neomarinimicrobiota bacterium]
MKKISILIIILFSIQVLFSLDISRLNESNNWEIIQDEQILIGWTEMSGFPICKATAMLPYPLESISAIIKDVDNYTNVFLRLTESQSLENDVIYIVLDMPFPFSSRDYIIRYTKEKSDSKWVFRFTAVTHQDVPIMKENVRLINAAGEWNLKPSSENETMVTYIWNGELRGDFPKWAYSRAWKTQGNEMMEWLKDALGD